MIKGIWISFFSLIVWLHTQAQGIKFFEGTFSEAKTEAKKQNKYLFLDCFAYGCAPCYKMDKEIFPLKTVGDFYNSHFICLKFNMIKGEGLEIKKMYDVTSYPTFLYLDSAGEVAHFSAGWWEAAKFIELGKIALNDTNNLKGLVNRFDRGERDTAFLKKLIRTTHRENRIVCEKALSIYWNNISDSELFKPENFRLFSYDEQDINSKAYKYVFTHQEDFLTKFVSKKDYSFDVEHATINLQHDSDFLYIKAAEEIKFASETLDSNLLKQAKQIAFKSKYDAAFYMVCIDELNYYKQTGNWAEFLKDADFYFNKFDVYKKKPFIYTNFADVMVKSTDNKDVLNKALIYCEKCISFGKDFDNMETYAYVLFKMERYKEAIEADNESIKLAILGNANHDEADELLEQIKSSLAGKN